VINISQTPEIHMYLVTHHKILSQLLIIFIKYTVQSNISDPRSISREKNFKYNIKKQQTLTLTFLHIAPKHLCR